MATLEQLLNAIQSQVSRVTTGLSMFDANVQVSVGKYWPPTKTLQQNVKMMPPSALVTIYDRKSSHDSTRWIPNTTALTVTTTNLVASPSTQLLPPLGTAVFAYSGTTQPGDAVSLVVQNRGVAQLDTGDGSVTYTPTRAVVAVLSPRDQLLSVPSALSALVAADPTGVGQWVTAVPSGTNLVVTSLVPLTTTLSSFTGNGGSVTTEIARRKREFQIVVWAPSPEIRTLVCDPIETLIAQIETFRGANGEFSGGLLLPDQTGARVTYVNDILIDDPALSDTYRRDLIFAVDYGITTTDQLYSVLAPVLSYNFTA